jgi:hypothetical protein
MIRRFYRLTLATSLFSVLLIAACNGERPPSASGASVPTTEGYAAASGACPTDGLVRECHVKLDAGGCYIGKQECRSGVWSSCGGQDVRLMSVRATETLIGIRAAGPSPTASICMQDPCDAYCSGYADTTPLTLAAVAGAPTSYTLSGTDIFGGAPGGFAKKSDCGSSSKGCNDVAPGDAYPRKCNGEDHFSRWDSCLADTHCDVTLDSGKGSCVANWSTTATTDPNWDETKGTWVSSVCAGVDITVSAACEDASGVAGFNICNRGNTTLTAASIGIYLDNGNGDFGSSTFSGGNCPSKTATCSPAVPGGSLAAGQCFRVTNATCSAWTGSGNPVAYVNPNGAIAECGGLKTASSSTGPSCNNNWADVKHKGSVCTTSSSAGSSYTASENSFQYNGLCPLGTRFQWKSLAYQATIPCNPGACNGTNSANIEFLGKVTNPSTAAVSSESLITKATSTSNCVAGTPGCPINLTTWANTAVANGATYSTLDLKIRLNPTPNGQAAPTLTSWSQAYDCIPNE